MQRPHCCRPLAQKLVARLEQTAPNSALLASVSRTKTPETASVWQQAEERLAAPGQPSAGPLADGLAGQNAWETPRASDAPPRRSVSSSSSNRSSSGGREELRHASAQSHTAQGSHDEGGHVDGSGEMAAGTSSRSEEDGQGDEFFSLVYGKAWAGAEPSPDGAESPAARRRRLRRESRRAGAGIKEEQEDQADLPAQSHSFLAEEYPLW